jgi:predicted enzyme related to lactoylglutathione lyase
MTGDILFAAAATADYAAAQAWYVRFFGREPDLVPHETEAAWQVAAGGWVYLVAEPERAGRATVTLIVDDLDARLAELAARGLAPETVEAVGAAGRKATVVDPDGNRLALAQVG